MTHTITFKTAAQAAIFEHELKGQISDGMWENTPGTDWQLWCRAETLVGDEIGRRGFWPRKVNFNFAHKMLVELVGYRMKGYAMTASGAESYSNDELKADLKAIMKTVRISLD